MTLVYACFFGCFFGSFLGVLLPMGMRELTKRIAAHRKTEWIEHHPAEGSKFSTKNPDYKPFWDLRRLTNAR